VSRICARVPARSATIAAQPDPIIAECRLVIDALNKPALIEPEHLVHPLLTLCVLIRMVNGPGGLFEAYGDEERNDKRRDVNAKAFPGARAPLRRMDVRRAQISFSRA
jgi:hypothetical protein